MGVEEMRFGRKRKEVRELVVRFADVEERRRRGRATGRRTCCLNWQSLKWRMKRRVKSRLRGNGVLICSSSVEKKVEQPEPIRVERE